MANIADMQALEMADALRRREISAVEAVEAALGKIDDGQRLNAFISVCAERALDEARASDERLAAGVPVGPLHGLPFSVKDLTNTEGVRTTHGSILYKDAVPGEDAVAVARARAAGAILIGKTTTPEFGHKPFTDGPLFGRTLNPWDENVTCGGSSGGAAVAVAANMGPLALGTDGGGSIRIPAACCGVVGMKATLGAIPNLQAPDLFGANSYTGPMARNVGDTRLLFDAIKGPDRRDPYGQVAPSARHASGQIRIAWLPRCGNILDPGIERVVSEAIGHAESLGLLVEQIEIDLASLEEPFLVILRSALLARFGTETRRRPEIFDRTLLATIEAGRRYSSADLVAAQAARTACFIRLQALFETFDVIASPTLSAPPLAIGTDPLGQVEIDGRNAGTIRGAWYPYTFPFNLTGHPAISIPCGLTDTGLPVGFQLVGRWHEDDLLLDIAEAFEQAIGFSARPPRQRRERQSD